MAINAKRCLSEAIKVFKGTFSDEQLRDVVEDLAESARALGTKPGSNVQRQLLLIGKDESRKRLRFALQNKRSKILNMLAAKGNDRATDIRVDSGLKARDAAISRTTGLERNVEGAKNSIAAMQKERSSIRTRQFDRALRAHPGLLDLWRSGQLEGDFIKEIHKAGSSGNPDARNAANIAKEFLEEGRLDLNDTGGFIDKMDRYFPRWHDETKITKGKEEWMVLMRKELDVDRTLGRFLPEHVTAESKEAFVSDFLDSVWGNITTGQRNLHIPEVGTRPGRPSRDLAARISRERILFFKTAEGELEYVNRFGKGHTLDMLMHRIRRDSENSVLMRELGTNPTATYDRMVDRLTNVAKKQGDQKSLKTFDAYRQSRMFSTLRAQFAEITGTVDIPSDAGWARWMRNTRIVQNMSKLGRILYTSINDLAVVPFAAASNGINPLEVYAQGFRNLAKTFAKKPDDLLKIMDDIGLVSDTLIGELNARHYANDIAGGSFGKAQNAFHKASGLPFWNDAWKSAVVQVYSRNLARMRKTPFGSLNVRVKNQMLKYGIRDAEWNMFADLKMEAFEGKEFIVPGSVNDLADSTVDRAMKQVGEFPVAPTSQRGITRARNTFKKGLESKMRTFLLLEADFAIPTPGARQRAFTKWGTSPGTFAGEAIRFFFQYKVFPITISTEILPRVLHGTNGKFDALGGLGILLPASMFLGYTSLAAKDGLSGKTPRSLKRYGTYVESLAQGGGGGLWMDYLLSDMNRFGQGVFETAGGPVPGQAAFIARKIQGSVWGKDFFGKADLFRFAMDNAPFVNLHFGRTLINYWFGYKLAEEMSPGYLKRLERFNAERGQDFWLPRPSDHVRDQKFR